MDQPTLGKLITDRVGRDAVHVPVFPAVCDVPVGPGTKLRILGPRELGGWLVGWLHADDATYDAVVDPFLTGKVPAGQAFYAVIPPNRVTGLRHVYTHPAFAPTKAPTGDDR